MSWRCPDSINLGVGKMVSYEFRFVGRGVGSVIPKMKSEVPGVLYSLTWNDFKNLHSFEGYPFIYDCKLKPIHTPKGIKLAYTYIHCDKEHSVPSDGYFLRVLEGAEDNHIDDAYLWKAYEKSRRCSKPRESAIPIDWHFDKDC